MSKDIKKHLISAGITFASSFVLFVMPVLLDPSWSYTGKAAFVALLTAAVRAAGKVTWEKWGPDLQSWLSA